MNRKERIKATIITKFSPVWLSLEDESSHHAGHAGASPQGETHYRLSLESAAFAGMGKVKRHQAIYAALDGEFKTGLHALGIEAFAPGER